MFKVCIIYSIAIFCISSCGAKSKSALLLDSNNKYNLSKGEIEQIKTKDMVTKYGNRFNNSKYYQLPLLHLIKNVNNDSIFIGLLIENSDSKRFLEQLKSDTASGKISNEINSNVAPIINASTISLSNKSYNRYIADLNGSLIVFINSNSNIKLQAGVDSLNKKLTH